MDTTEKFVLKFGPTSEWPGQYVNLDSSSGGYPYGVESPLQAHRWDREHDAIMYASMFHGKGGSYTAYAIEPKVYILKVEVVEKPAEVDPRPHSRACRFVKHNHGSECHSNCPTCGGRAL